MPYRVEVRTGKRCVFEIALLIVSLLIGIAGIAAGAPAGAALSALMPGSLIWAFYVASLLAGMVGLAALWIPSSFKPLLCEIAAMLVLGGVWTSYGIAIVAVAGLAGGPSAAVLATFGIASLSRVVQIRNEARQARRISALIPE